MDFASFILSSRNCIASTVPICMPLEAEAVHGLSTVFLSDKPFFEERAEELLDFLGDAPLVAHNAAFDFGFLNHELGRCGRPAVCMKSRTCGI